MSYKPLEQLDQIKLTDISEQPQQQLHQLSHDINGNNGTNIDTSSNKSPTHKPKCMKKGDNDKQLPYHSSLTTANVILEAKQLWDKFHEQVQIDDCQFKKLNRPKNQFILRIAK